MYKQSEVEVPASVEPSLAAILAWPRPHGSPAELKFRDYLSGLIKKHTGSAPLVLTGGSLYTMIPLDRDEAATTLFSCHMDTAELAQFGVLDDKGKYTAKSVTYDPHMGIVGLSKDSYGGCLGADDGVGIWIMLSMLEAKIPGGYIFHTGEEQGGIGARAVLTDHKALLKNFDAAIAFDRPGDYEVITHQGGSECASKKFAVALCEQLRKLGLGQFVPSERGVFTDTKVYRGVIPECTNIGVGYTNQHTKNEDLDYGHALQLRDACLKVDWHSLPIDRDPEATLGPAPSWLSDKPTSPPPTAKTLPVPEYEEQVSEYDSILATPRDVLDEWICSKPEEVADTIIRLTVEIAQLRGEVTVLRTQAFRV